MGVTALSEARRSGRAAPGRADAGPRRAGGAQVRWYNDIVRAFLLSRPAAADSVLNSAWYLPFEQFRGEAVRGCGSSAGARIGALVGVGPETHAMFLARSLALGLRTSLSFGAGGAGFVARRLATAAPAMPAATATPTAGDPTFGEVPDRTLQSNDRRSTSRALGSCRIQRAGP